MPFYKVIFEKFLGIITSNRCLTFVDGTRSDLGCGDSAIFLACSHSSVLSELSKCQVFDTTVLNGILKRLLVVLMKE